MQYSNFGISYIYAHIRSNNDYTYLNAIMYIEYIYILSMTYFCNMYVYLSIYLSMDHTFVYIYIYIYIYYSIFLHPICPAWVWVHHHRSSRWVGSTSRSSGPSRQEIARVQSPCRVKKLEPLEFPGFLWDLLLQKGLYGICNGISLEFVVLFVFICFKRTLKRSAYNWDFEREYDRFPVGGRLKCWTKQIQIRSGCTDRCAALHY